MGALIMPRMTSQQLRDFEIRMHGKIPKSESVNPVDDESELQDLIVAYCRVRMWFVVFSGMHRRTSTPIGTPDFIIYADGGRVFTIETKSKDGKQTPEQLGAQLLLDKLGHNYHLVRSMEDFTKVVES